MKQLPEEGRGGARAVKPQTATDARSRTRARTEAKVRTTASIRLEDALERTNFQRALHRVEHNGGAPGIDGMAAEDLRTHLRQHWPAIARSLLDGTYRPAPVRRVLIAKARGGQRPLGIPTVLDRFLQQALLQALQPVFDPAFSPHSYGFRPGKSAHQAVRAARAHIAAGYRIVVDIDIASFFDRVDHDVLMGRLATRIGDKRILKIIRRYLEAGVMVEGVKVRSEMGTPQGGPLSPLLANVLLDDLDHELQRRGHRFVRYADDCAPRRRREEAFTADSKHLAAQEMRVGPSDPGCRVRVQTPGCCSGSMAGVVSETEKAGSTRQVRAGKTNASEPLRTCRKRMDVIGTRLQLLAWDKGFIR